MFIFCCLKALKAPNDHGAKNMPTCKEALRGSSIGHAMSWTCDMLVDNHSFPSMAAPWVKKLENVIGSQEPINAKAAQALGLLKEHGLAHTVKARPSQMLVHVSNRAGALVNPFDVMQKGQAICQVGWDLAKIKQAVAIELPADGCKRQAIVDANAQLAQQSNGIIARPTGMEKYSTLSVSHTTCFLKSLESGCKVMDEMVPLEQLVGKQDDLERMLSQGWDWTVIASKVDEEVPHLAGLLTQAFNSHLF